MNKWENYDQNAFIVNEHIIKIKTEGDKLQLENKQIKETCRLANEVLDMWRGKAHEGAEKLVEIREIVESVGAILEDEKGTLLEVLDR